MEFFRRRWSIPHRSYSDITRDTSPPFLDILNIEHILAIIYEILAAKTSKSLFTWKSRERAKLHEHLLSLD